jgi:SET domain-containing protein
MKKKRIALPRIKSKYARYSLRSGRSGIHRFGVYALDDIPARRIVIEYTGRLLSWGQASRIPFEKGIYLANLKRGFALDGGVGGSGAQFINHSCAPNLNVRHAQGRLLLASRRKIRAGEELTVHYGYPTKLRRVSCRCGARNCRGTLRLVVR